MKLSSSTNGNHNHAVPGTAIGAVYSRALLACSLLVLLLSASQRSYAPKQGIHTIVHITPADFVLWGIAVLMLLPLLERTAWGRPLSWAVALALLAAGFVLSHHGAVFASLLRHLKSGQNVMGHIKDSLKPAAPIVLGLYQIARLSGLSGLALGAAFPTDPAAAAGSGRSGTREPLRLPALPAEVWALLVVTFLSALMMALPADSLGAVLASDDGKEHIRKAALFLIQMFQYLGIALFLFLLTLHHPGRIRLAVRTVMLAALAAILTALWQRFHGAVPLHVEGFMQSRKAYGGFLCLVLPLALGSLLGSRRRPIQAGFAVLIFLGLASIVSGGPFWCALMGLMITGLLFDWQKGLNKTPALRPGRGTQAAAGCLAAAVVILLLLPMNREQLTRRFFGIRETMAQAHRPGGTLPPLATENTGEAPPPSDPNAPILKKEYIEWIAGIYMATDHFWLGVGPGQYQLNIGQYYGQEPDPTIRLEPDSNNLYFVYLASLGFAGLLALLQLFLTSLARSWRLIRSVDRGGSDLHGWWLSVEGRALQCGVFGSLAAMIVVNLFTAQMVRGVGIMIAFLIALAALGGQAADESRTAKSGDSAPGTE